MEAHLLDGLPVVIMALFFAPYQLCLVVLREWRNGVALYDDGAWREQSKLCPSINGN